MKSLLVLVPLSVMLLVPDQGSGQCPSDKGQIEFALSHGFVTESQAFKQDAENSNETQTYSSGTNFITVRYFLFNRLAVGLVAGATNETNQFTETWNPSTVASISKVSRTTVAMEFCYIYTFRKYFEAYTLIGFGPTFISITNTTTPTSYSAATVTTNARSVLNCQFTPIGLRAGGKLGCFAEFGIGYKGIFNLGISYRLGPKSWWRQR